jgi:hypothetical protein
MSNAEPQEIAESSIKQGKYNFLDRLANRNLPTEDFTIYLDEGAAYRRLRIDEILADTTDKEELAALEAERAIVTKQIKDSAATVTLRAITSVAYDKLIAQAKERFPVKYEKTSNPITGRTVVEEKPSQDRDEYFNELYLAATIVKAEFDGAIDEEIDTDWVKGFQNIAPIDAVRRIAEAAWKMRMTGQWMDELESEDFSPRS